MGSLHEKAHYSQNLPLYVMPPPCLNIMAEDILRHQWNFAPTMSHILQHHGEMISSILHICTYL